MPSSIDFYLAAGYLLALILYSMDLREPLLHVASRYFSGAAVFEAKAEFHLGDLAADPVRAGFWRRLPNHCPVDHVRIRQGDPGEAAGHAGAL